MNTTITTPMAIQSGDIRISWTAMESCAGSVENFTVTWLNKNSSATTPVASAVLEPGVARFGERDFAALVGGPGYYFRVTCNACRWTLTLT